MENMFQCYIHFLCNVNVISIRNVCIYDAMMLTLQVQVIQYYTESYTCTIHYILIYFMDFIAEVTKKHLAKV